MGTRLIVEWSPHRWLFERGDRRVYVFEERIRLARLIGSDTLQFLHDIRWAGPYMGQAIQVVNALPLEAADWLGVWPEDTRLFRERDSHEFRQWVKEDGRVLSVTQHRQIWNCVRVWLYPATDRFVPPSAVVFEHWWSLPGSVQLAWLSEQDTTSRLVSQWLSP